MSALALAVDVLNTFIAAVPNPDPVQPPGTEGFITIMGWVKWGGFAVAVVALIAAAVMMMIGRSRGEGGEHVGKLAMVLVGVVIIGAAAGLVGVLVGA